MSVPELIAAAGDRLTATERRLAEVVLAEPTLLAFGTVSELAGRASTSRPSVVRFANKLGFGGFSDLQAHVREGISEQLLRPSQRIRRMEEGPGPVQRALQGALAALFEEVTPERLDELAKLECAAVVCLERCTSVCDTAVECALIGDRERCVDGCWTWGYCPTPATSCSEVPNVACYDPSAPCT